MQELAVIIQSQSFKENQKEFFAQHCQVFDAEAENKLEYTAIHKKYEEMVEAEIKAKIGEEKLKKIEIGLKDYVNVDR